MTRTTNQSGFSAVEALVVVVIVGVIGVVGFMVYNRGNKTAYNTEPTKTSGTTGASKTATVSQAPGSISSTSDLDKASATLDQNDPVAGNNSDSSQLDSQTNGL